MVEPPLRHELAFALDRQRHHRIVVMRREAGQRAVAHQHQELDLRQMRWRRGVESRGSIFKREQAVARKMAAFDEMGRIQRLGRKALDGMAVEADDSH